MTSSAGLIGRGSVEPDQDPVDVREYIRPIWSRKWLVLAIVVGITVAAYLYESSRPKRYEASTSVYVTNSDVNQALFGSTDQTDPDRRSQNDATLIKSRTNAEQVAKAIGFKGDPGALLS